MAEAAAPAKKAATKAKKPAVKPLHPAYSVMITAAVKELKERTGSSRHAILKHILANYKVGDEKKAGNRVRIALRKGVESGALKQVKGTGASGSFKIAKEEKPVVKKSPKKATPKKPAANKTPKKAAKKPAAKKTPKKAAKKSPKKVAKKPAAKKPTPKKATKKPAAKKAAKK